MIVPPYGSGRIISIDGQADHDMCVVILSDWALTGGSHPKAFVRVAHLRQPGSDGAGGGGGGGGGKDGKEEQRAGSGSSSGGGGGGGGGQVVAGSNTSSRPKSRPKSKKGLLMKQSSVVYREHPVALKGVHRGEKGQSSEAREAEFFAAMKRRMTTEQQAKKDKEAKELAQMSPEDRARAEEEKKAKQEHEANRRKMMKVSE